MSDLTDVQQVLVTAVAAAVYPNGTGAASVSGSPIVVYAGWPTASTLDTDLITGKAHVTVYPTMTETNKTRYSKDWVPQTLSTATITATLVGQVITIGGSVAPFTPTNVAAIISNKAYVYAALNTDTLATIATALAALIAVDWPGTAAVGAVATVAGAANVVAARIGVTGTSTREIRRQERVFQITVWANTPTQRDVIGAALDVALAATEFLTMTDGYAARIVYRGSHITDDLQKAKLYRRDFQYSVEYATTQTEVDTQITQDQLGISVKNDGATQYASARITTF